MKDLRRYLLEIEAFCGAATFRGSWRLPLAAICACLLLFAIACSKAPVQVFKPKPTPTEPSNIEVEVKDGGPVVLTTTSAIFELMPDGYLRASLRKNDDTATLDEPIAGRPDESDYVVVHGQEVHFSPEFDQVRVTEAMGKLGAGKRVEIPSHALGHDAASIKRSITIEVYDRFPEVAIETVEYQNMGSAEIQLDRMITQRHHLSAAASDMNATPLDLWIYSGASARTAGSGAVKLTRAFSQNGLVEKDVIPVVAVWKESVGEAVGSLQVAGNDFHLPASASGGGSVDISMRNDQISLKAGETRRAPRSFLAVYSGDYREPLRLWVGLLSAEQTPISAEVQRQLVAHGIGSTSKPVIAEPKKARSKAPATSGSR